jgi:hypothetical protein
MNIILTQYIYPIENPINLSEKLGLSFDNPRSEEEIEIVKRYIKYSLGSPDKMYEYDRAMRLPISAPRHIVSIRQALNKFKGVNKTDEYKSKFLNEASRKDVFGLLAKMWIVLRYNDEGEFQSLKEYKEEKDKEEGRGGFIMLGEDSPILTNEKSANDFSYLLSLLINTDSDYFGGSFLLHSGHYDLAQPKIDRWLNKAVVFWTFMCYQPNQEDESRWLVDFSFIKDAAIHTGKLLDEIFDEKSKDKLLYVGSMLRLCSEEIKDPKMKLVTLVSIIELMLTHAPDSNKFNVEDSISKQFKLKLSILLYQDNNKIDLLELKKRLTDIYNQRSNVAHGNFKEYDNLITKEVKNMKDKDEWSDLKAIARENFVSDCYDYVKVIIQSYLKDRHFIEYLKAN